MAVPLPIETERLLIRPFLVEADTEPMFVVYGDAEVMRFIPGGPLAGVEAVRTTLEAHAMAQQNRGFAFWAVVERGSGRVIGDAGFGIFEPTGDVELGYTLARDCWDCGYATEAAGACLAAGIAHLAAPRIVAVVDEANEASLRVAERIGMTRIEMIEAHGRPHVLYARHAPPVSSVVGLEAGIGRHEPAALDAEAGACAQPIHQLDEVQGVELEGVSQVGSRRQRRQVGIGDDLAKRGLQHGAGLVRGHVSSGVCRIRFEEPADRSVDPVLCVTECGCQQDENCGHAGLGLPDALGQVETAFVEPRTVPHLSATGERLWMA